MNKIISSRQANRLQLQQIIAGLTEGVILIDPDQTISWANEAALGMHGVGSVNELGGTVAEYRDRFRLNYRNNWQLAEGQYPIDRVVAGEAFSDVIVEVTRAGQNEPQWVHRVRSLVLTDEAGRPDCLVLVVTDATDHFEAEERFERSFNVNPAPAIICRLADLRYVKVNEGFLEMTGYEREEVIGRSVYKLDVLERAERRELAVQRLSEGRAIPQMEACLSLPRGGTKFVVVAGKPIEIADQPCMLFTFMDLEPRKKAENALVQSEERFAKSFRLSPIPTTISKLDKLRLLEVNEAFCAETGFAAVDVIGRSAVEMDLWASATACRALEEALRTSGSVRNLEMQLRTKTGELIDCLVCAETLTIHDQACVLSTMQDITERKQTQAELIAAIEAVMKDTSWFSQVVIEKLAAIRAPQAAGSADASSADLTGREREMLTLMCRGLADKEIAKALNVSLNTVRNHIARIYRKIGVHRRSAAVLWAQARGFTGGKPTEPANRRA